MKNNIIKSLLGITVFLFGMTAVSWAVPTPAAADDLESLTKKVFPSVVRVEARDGWRKVATGVVISKDGYIVTTALVSPRQEKIFVITSEGDEVEAEFLGMDPETHLALIKAKNKKWKPIALGRFEDLAPDTDIAVVCFSPEEKAAITKGIVSSVSGDILRLNVTVIPGASGSPVIDMQGRMVGLVRGAYVGQVVSVGEPQTQIRNLLASRVEVSSSGMASAIPVDIVNKVTTEIRETGKVQRGWLGVSLSITETGEVEIVKVTDESPADDAGLLEGDLILEIAGEEVVDREMLAREIRMRRPGDTVEMKVEREGQQKNIDVELGEYSQQNIMQEFEMKFPELFFSPKEGTQTFRFSNPTEREGFFTVLGSQKYIGVSIQALNPELAEFFGVKDGTGLLINKIEEDSPAAKSGLKVGDVVVRADGKVLTSVDHFARLIQSQEEGDKVKLEVLRDKKALTIEVEVALDKRRGRRFSPLASNSLARTFQYFGNAFKSFENTNQQNLKNYRKALSHYQEIQKQHQENLKSSIDQEIRERSRALRDEAEMKAQESQRLLQEFQQQVEEQQKKAKEQQKKAQEKLRIAVKRYRCIKV